MLIDDHIYEHIKDYRISLNRPTSNYCRCYIHIDGKSILLHRYIYSLNKNINGLTIDHIDRNPLNNKLDNLRLVTLSENNENRWKSQVNSKSVFKGVVIAKKGIFYEDGKRANKFRSNLYFSQKFAYIDYVKRKKSYCNTFYYKDINEFPLEKITPRMHRPLLSNKSGYRGVCWCKRASKWRANIKLNEKQTFLGYFDNAINAAKAYDKKAFEKSGYMAFLNFPEKYTIFL